MHYTFCNELLRFGYTFYDEFLLCCYTFYNELLYACEFRGILLYFLRKALRLGAMASANANADADADEIANADDNKEAEGQCR